MNKFFLFYESNTLENKYFNLKAYQLAQFYKYVCMLNAIVALIVFIYYVVQDQNDQQAIFISNIILILLFLIISCVEGLILIKSPQSFNTIHLFFQVFSFLFICHTSGSGVFYEIGPEIKLQIQDDTGKIQAGFIYGTYFFLSFNGTSLCYKYAQLIIGFIIAHIFLSSRPFSPYSIFYMIVFLIVAMTKTYIDEKNERKLFLDQFKELHEKQVLLRIFKKFSNLDFVALQQDEKQDQILLDYCSKSIQKKFSVNDSESLIKFLQQIKVEDNNFESEKQSKQLFEKQSKNQISMPKIAAKRNPSRQNTYNDINSLYNKTKESLKYQQQLTLNGNHIRASNFLAPNRQSNSCLHKPCDRMFLKKEQYLIKSLPEYQDQDKAFTKEYQNQVSLFTYIENPWSIQQNQRNKTIILISSLNEGKKNGFALQQQNESLKQQNRFLGMNIECLNNNISIGKNIPQNRYTLYKQPSLHTEINTDKQMLELFFVTILDIFLKYRAVQFKVFFNDVDEKAFSFEISSIHSLYTSSNSYPISSQQQQNASNNTTSNMQGSLNSQLLISKIDSFGSNKCQPSKILRSSQSNQEIQIQQQNPQSGQQSKVIYQYFTERIKNRQHQKVQVCDSIVKKLGPKKEMEIIIQESHSQISCHAICYFYKDIGILQSNSNFNQQNSQINILPQNITLSSPYNKAKNKLKENADYILGENIQPQETNQQVTVQVSNQTNYTTISPVQQKLSIDGIQNLQATGISSLLHPTQSSQIQQSDKFKNSQVQNQNMSGLLYSPRFLNSSHQNRVGESSEIQKNLVISSCIPNMRSESYNTEEGNLLNPNIEVPLGEQSTFGPCLVQSHFQNTKQALKVQQPSTKDDYQNIFQEANEEEVEIESENQTMDQLQSPYQFDSKSGNIFNQND